MTAKGRLNIACVDVWPPVDASQRAISGGGALVIENAASATTSQPHMRAMMPPAEASAILPSPPLVVAGCTAHVAQNPRDTAARQAASVTGTDLGGTRNRHVPSSQNASNSTSPSTAIMSSKSSKAPPALPPVDRFSLRRTSQVASWRQATSSNMNPPAITPARTTLVTVQHTTMPTTIGSKNTTIWNTRMYHGGDVGSTSRIPPSAHSRKRCFANSALPSVRQSATSTLTRSDPDMASKSKRQAGEMNQPSEPLPRAAR